ncbi:MAG TPA: GTPase Era [Candidatus Merdibacter merdavium]|uniref:GTPase Era n=1 Tax=Candidatus Merdibacter merdavium TaxID=2838692 RepID=A0A9D2NQM3_9FIRM|nr:GTPase Era [Candidatus Merdibacter merdavium]
MGYKSGFIAIIGRPNAGKSTLLNALLHQKIAIMSPKPNTTRNNIMGILTTNEAQYVFIDTPGIHKPRHELGRTLNKNAYTAIAEADINALIIDITKPYGSGDAFLLERLKNSEVPCFLLVNKIDLLPREQVLERLLEWQQRFDFDEIIPLSALKEDNVDELLRVIDSYLQEGVKYFPDDMVSDHGESFRIAEIIREKILFRTEEEVPHSIAVVIENREEDDTQIFLQAMVIVERPTQKSILIGKQGSMIRSIRIAAQRELRQMLGKRVQLELYVRVEENWRNRESKLRQFGYDEHE